MDNRKKNDVSPDVLQTSHQTDTKETITKENSNSRNAAADSSSSNQNPASHLTADQQEYIRLTIEKKKADGEQPKKSWGAFANYLKQRILSGDELMLDREELLQWQADLEYRESARDQDRKDAMVYRKVIPNLSGDEVLGLLEGIEGGSIKQWEPTIDSYPVKLNGEKVQVDAMDLLEMIKSSRQEVYSQWQEDRRQSGIKFMENYRKQRGNNGGNQQDDRQELEDRLEECLGFETIRETCLRVATDDHDPDRRIQPLLEEKYSHEWREALKARKAIDKLKLVVISPHDEEMMKIKNKSLRELNDLGHDNLVLHWLSRIREANIKVKHPDDMPKVYQPY